MKNKFMLGITTGFIVAMILGCVSVLRMGQMPLGAQGFFRLPSFYYGVTRVVITTDTVAATDSRIEANGGGSSYTIALPALASVPTGKEYNFKQLGTGVVTLDADAAETIDGVTTATLPGQYYSLTIYKCAALSAWCIQ